ncbi:MAG TPA: hypothetical protein VFX23_08575, partial [Limnobacter sp.]|uniref:hypothetical protein n=1 Tax=Limnobacter sp. TaxID=2003368 RepID=UPI002E34D60D
ALKEVHFSKIGPRNDPVQFNEIQSHIAKKAGYQLKDNGHYVAIGHFDRFCNWIMGNGATDRYKRNTFDANQHAAASLITARHRQSKGGLPSSIASDKALKSRVYRQDFMRYNAGLRNSLRAKPKSYKAFMTLGHSRRNRCAMFMSRMAHFADGLNELAAAPTGLSVKLSKLIFTPNLPDHSRGNYARLLSALPGIAVLVSAVLYGALGLGFHGLLSTFAPTKLALGLSKLDGVSGALGASTYLLGVASSLTTKHEDLTPAILSHIDNNRQRYLNRLVLLLRSVANQSGGEVLLRKALKIEQSGKKEDGFTAPWQSKSERRAALLDKLLHTIRTDDEGTGVAAKVERVLGEHFTSAFDPIQQTSRELNSGSRWDRRLITARERDFVRITNLLEHARTEKHMGDDGFNNNRTNIEKGLSRIRNPLYKATSAALRSAGANQSAAHVQSVLTDEHKAKIALESSKPAHLAERKFSIERILNNPHQYAWWVRGSAMGVKFAHTLSFGVAMSTNYLLTRPFAAAHRRIEALITGGISSRSLSFSFGRAISGAIWVCFYLLTPIGGIYAATQIIGVGHAVAVTTSSTAAQMIALSGIAFCLTMLVEHGLSQLGGYKGDSTAPVRLTNKAGKAVSFRWT